MSKKPRTTKSNFNYQNQTTLTPLRQIQTNWDLASLYYKNERDHKIEADLQTAEKAYAKFVKKWTKKDFTRSGKVLAEALKEKEQLAGMPEISKPGRYFGFRASLDTNDKAAEKHLALLSRRLRKVNDSLLFFTLTLGKLSKRKQREFLKDPELKHFRYHLKNVFENARYDLSEEQEKIVNLKGSQSYVRWVAMTEKIVSNREVIYKGRKLPIPEALETIDTLPRAEKNKLWSLIITEMKQIAEVAEHEFNAIITDVRTEEELRGYQKPYSSTALGYEDDEQSIENLVSVVSKDGFRLSRKFYKLKAKYHGVKSIQYANKYDSIGSEPIIPFSQAVEICRDVFYSVKPVYGEIFDHMLLNGQIDVYPKKGKRGGAFMSGSVGHPTHVFLNHLDNFKSLETLAHEMGHAIHTERSKIQTPFYQGHSITTAETASTLFENLVFDAVYEQVQESKKMILLHDRITRDIATIQRQIAFFNAELEIHNTIFTNGAMSKEELCSIMTKHLRAYLGSAVEVTKDDGYSYVYIPHLRYGFYVYTYTFGILMSTTMANNYKADKNYIEQIDTFLKSGASASVADIFKSIGLNTRSAAVFISALKNHAADIAQFAKFVAGKKK